MTVWVLVVVLTLPGMPAGTRVTSADQPFFRTLGECQRALPTNPGKLPRYMQDIVCEPHVMGAR